MRRRWHTPRWLPVAVWAVVGGGIGFFWGLGATLTILLGAALGVLFALALMWFLGRRRWHLGD